MIYVHDGYFKKNGLLSYIRLVILFVFFSYLTYLLPLFVSVPIIVIAATLLVIAHIFAPKNKK